MSAKERVMAIFNHQKPDRVPCFGANSTLTYEQMEKVQAYWPEGHIKAETMAKQGIAGYSVIGFDAIRIPFAQTFEAEALGAKIKPGRLPGGKEGFPGIDDPPAYTFDDVLELPDDFLSRGTIPELLKAVRIVKKEMQDEVPVVAGIVGPFSIAASLLGSVPLLKASFKTPDKMRPWLELAEKAGTTLAHALIDAGADIISCEDMAASPQLIAPKTYGEYLLPYQQKQFEAISVPTILHICGKVDSIVEWMGQTGADCLSVEAKSDLSLAREKCRPDMIFLGGVDTATTLFLGEPETVRQDCEACIAQGFQILGPGCAIGPGSPNKNLLAMVETAKAH